MPATAADIAAGSRRQALAEFSDAARKTIFPSARDGAAEPAEGFFDAVADADTAVDQRGALLGRARRFAVDLDDLVWLDPREGTPSVQVTDPDLAVDLLMGCARIELDLEDEVTRLELF
jgi:hypothetical protein